MGDRSSARTIQRILREKGLFYGKVKKIEKLTARHKERRVEYAKQMRKEKWGTILFSDEKTFQLGAGEEYAWQEPGDREVREYVTHAPKLNVWGAIGAHVKSPLYFFGEENMNSERYRTVLEEDSRRRTLFMLQMLQCMSVKNGSLCKMVQEHILLKNRWPLSKNSLAIACISIPLNLLT